MAHLYRWNQEAASSPLMPMQATDDATNAATKEEEDADFPPAGSAGSGFPNAPWWKSSTEKSPPTVNTEAGFPNAP